MLAVLLMREAAKLRRQEATTNPELGERVRKMLLGNADMLDGAADRIAILRRKMLAQQPGRTTE